MRFKEELDRFQKELFKNIKKEIINPKFFNIDINKHIFIIVNNIIINKFKFLFIFSSC